MPPSRGCKTCRDAKVKCDETRPHCNRCTRLGLVCVGYRTEEELIFRDQNAAAQSLSARAASQRLRSATTISIIPQESNAGQWRQQISSISPDPRHPRPWLRQPIPAQLEPSLESRAVSLFFSNFVLAPCNHGLTYGYLNDLPQLFLQCSPGSLLDSAVQACSLAFYSSATRERSLMIRAASAHGDTLRKLRQVLTDEQAGKEDETLLTMLVLDFFELMTGGHSHPLGTHTQGLAAVVAQRGRNQVFKPVGWNLFRVAHRRIQTLQLITSAGPLADSVQLLNTLNTDLPEVRLASVTVGVNDVLHQAKGCLDSPVLEPDILESLVARMKELDATLQSWRLGLPAQWHFVPSNDPGGAGRQALEDHAKQMHQYHDMWVADTWNYGRLCRILLLESIMRCYLKLGRSSVGYAMVDAVVPEQTITTAPTVVRRLIDDIVASAPFLTGSSGSSARNVHPTPVHTSLGMYLLQPALAVIRSASSATVEQIQKVDRLSYEIGIKLRGQS